MRHLPRRLAAFLLLAAPPLAAQTVTGRLVERETDAAIPGGTVRLLAADGRELATATTDSAGAFVLQAPAPGEYTFLAEGPAHERSEFDGVTLGADGMRVRLVISRRAVVLEEVEVTAPARDEHLRFGGFYERMQRRAGGRFIAREQIERTAPTHLVDLLRTIPSLDVQVGGGGGMGGSRALRVRLRQQMSVRSPCEAVFYLDGMQLDAASVQEVEPRDLEGVEVYAHGNAPARFNSVAGSTCGVIVLWRRDTRSR